MNFKLTNEQIVYIYTEYSKAEEVIENDLQKQLKLIKANIATLEEVYGGDVDFNHKQHNLYKKLMLDELPKRLNLKLDMIRNIKSIFEEVYSLIAESEPTLIQKVLREQFEESDGMKDIINQLEQMKNEPIN